MNARVALGLALISAFACSRANGGDVDSASAMAKAPAASPAPVVHDSVAARGGALTATGTPNANTCVSEGDWQRCSVEKRLTDAGFVPIKKGDAPKGIFDVDGTTYALGPAELSVYVFKSAKAREAASAAIDTVTVTKGSGASPWAMQPTFISSNNLVAVLVSDNGRLIERVQLAITAGLPSATH